MIRPFIKSLLLFGMTSALLGCFHLSGLKSSFTPKRTVAQPSVPAKIITQKRNVPAFTRVKVIGNIDVNLHTGYQRPHVVLHGDARDLALLKVTVSDSQLRLSLDKTYPHYGRVRVDINSRYLNVFEYHGVGIIRGKGLNSRLLDLIIENQGPTTLQGQLGVHYLYITGNGYSQIQGIQSPDLKIKLAGQAKVKLVGVVHLTHLNMKGDSWLSFYWVKSDFLSIRGYDKSFIQLAGAVDKLDVELWNQSRFNGRYLRAQRSFVKTHHESVAEISAVKRQHTLATDISDIRFFNIPNMKTDFMAFGGAVLDMRDLASPYVQEYSQYNK